MRANMTYTNEFTDEVFSDREDCVKAEKESKAEFIKGLIADMELIKGICNSHNYCESCPFEHGECIVCTFTDNYLDIVRGLQGINDWTE